MQTNLVQSRHRLCNYNRDSWHHIETAVKWVAKIVALGHTNQLLQPPATTHPLELFREPACWFVGLLGNLLLPDKYDEPP